MSNDDPNKDGYDRSAPIAAGLILAGVALVFALGPRIVAWADGDTPGAGIWAGALWAMLLVGGFVAVFWFRGRSRGRNTRD